MNRNHSRTIARGGGLAIACLLWAGIATAGGAGAGADAAAGETVIVEMKDYQFVPRTITIKAGTTVRWVNMEGRTSHDVVIIEGVIESGRFFPEEHWEYRFDEPGTYPYFCAPHGEERDMKGVVEVVP